MAGDALQNSSNDLREFPSVELSTLPLIMKVLVNLGGSVFLLLIVVNYCCIKFLVLIVKFIKQLRSVLFFFLFFGIQIILLMYFLVFKKHGRINFFLGCPGIMYCFWKKNFFLLVL